MKNRTIWIAVILCIVGFRAVAQPGDPGGDPDVPISGIEWLLLAGGLFGSGRIYRNFKKRQ